MLKLILWEFKKMFQNKALLLILLAIIILPPFFVPELDKHNRSGMVTDCNGNEIMWYEKLEQEDAYLSNYNGDLIDETFWNQIEEDYEKNKFITQLDPIKIESKYGKHFTYQELWEKIGELDESYFYDQDETYYARKDYNCSGVSSLYQLKEKLSKEYYQEHYMTKYTYEADRSEKEKKEQEAFNQQIDSMQHLYVGNTLSFEHLFSVLNIVAFVLSFFFLFITPSIINKEGKVLGLIKTTKRGKRQLATLKIVTIILLSILIPLISTLFTTLVIHFRYGLYNWHVSAMLISNSYLFYSIFILYIKRLFLMMLGCLGMSVVGTFLSSLFKNSYISLGTMIVFYLTWMFSTGGTGLIDWKTFTPMNILLDSGRGILEGIPLYVWNHLFSLESIMYIFWTIAAALLFYLSYIGYKRRQITNES